MSKHRLLFFNVDFIKISCSGLCMSEKKKYRITYDRQNCIGAAACEAVCPKFWHVGSDGKADLKGSKKSGDKFVLDIAEEDLKCNKEAAEGCPVNVIHIKNLDSDEEII